MEQLNTFELSDFHVVWLKDRQLDIANLYQKWCGAQVHWGVKPHDYACIPVEIDEETVRVVTDLSQSCDSP